jgi:hypothetical protein
MPANTSPIFTLTPNVPSAKITTTHALTKSDGASTATSNDFMVKVFTSGANGSYVDFIRFRPVGTAAVSSVACVLRAFLSTVADPSAGATTAADTHQLGEIQVGIIPTASTTVQASFYDIPIKAAIPAGTYIHVAQSIAQTTNQQWQATVFGGDY